MGDHKEAKKICMDSMYDFRCNINDYLADERGEYLYGWTIEDASYVKNEIHSVIGDILSTCMADHVSYELCIVRNEYDEAFKKQNIPACQMALANLMKELSMVHAGCKAIA